MTWPTVAITTTNLDAGTDSPATARTDLLDAVTKQNQMIAHVSAFAATVLDDTTAAAARATLGAAALGANTDITSLGGITTPLSKAQGGTGVVACTVLGQFVRTMVGAVATGTTVIPIDDTVPQNTEGNEYMSLTITPKSASSILEISVVMSLASSVANNMIAALFQDSTAGALAAISSNQANNNATQTLEIRHTMVAGTTSATTFKARAGGSAAGTTTFNGAAGGRYFGGISASSMSITEYLP